MYDCVGTGICPSDYICLLDRYPGADEKVMAKETSRQGGGPVATALAALGRWGRKTALVSVVGGDEDGRFVRAELEKDGVDTRFIRVKKRAATPRAFIWVDTSSGVRTVVLDDTGTPGLRARDIKLADLPPCRVFHTDGRDAEACLKAMRHYRKSGAEICIDAGSPRERMDEMIALTSHFVASRNFTAKFFGRGVTAEKACEKLMGRGPLAVVVTLGPGGCAGATNEGLFRIPGHSRKGFVVDTNGAGDVFHGGYIYGLLEGWPVEKCARFANAAAFLKCSRPGGRAGIPRVDDVRNLAKIPTGD